MPHSSCLFINHPTSCTFPYNYHVTTSSQL